MNTAEEIVRDLERMGTEQNRKIYARHGVRSPMYGVSYANLGTLKKKLKTNQGLAEELWASGNHDARVLATMIADPRAASEDAVTAWAEEVAFRDGANYVLCGAVAEFTAQTAFAQTAMERWTESEEDAMGAIGWALLAHIAANPHERPDIYFETYLETIVRSIHDRKNRTRDKMNAALIAIGLRNDYLRGCALEAAKKIGKVTVDHGDTSCKTPDAAQYIEKTLRRKERLQKR